MPIKILKTYSEQVDILISRGCIIDDREEAVRFLSFVSYYRLSGYFLPFKYADNTFKKETTFSRIAALYEFDHRLRTLLYRAIGDIEISARTTIAHCHAKHYGAIGYMSGRNYNEIHDHGRFLTQFRDTIENNTKNLIVQHHIEKYQGNFPLWVAAEFFTLGQLSHFYSHLVSDVRGEIAAVYETKAEYFGSWLLCLTILRNMCAHYQRLYYISFPIIAKLPKGDAQYNGRKIFSQLVVLKLLYRTQPTKWNSIIEELYALVDQYRVYLDFSHIGFPEDWNNVLRW